MRKVHSKSILSTKKNKSTATFPDKKSSTRTMKGSSCVKMASQHTEQNSNHMPVSREMQKSNLLSLSQKLIQKLPGHISAEERGGGREKAAKQCRSTFQNSQNEGCLEELRKVKGTNQELVKENGLLKDRCVQLQETSLRDKQKIKNLIIRINEVKNSQVRSGSKTLHPSTSQLHLQPQSSSNSYAILPTKKQLQTPYKVVTSGPCQNQECIDRKKYLESELYHQRIIRDKLELEKREWEHNRQLLKNQYNQLLEEIRDIRNDDI